MFSAAAIDLGSNSFRLLVAAVGRNGVTPLVNELNTVRLVSGLEANGHLTLAAMQEAGQTLSHYRRLIDLHRCEAIRACGTHALRQALNREEFLTDAAAILGVPIEVLNREEEALLTMAGVQSFFTDRPTDPLIVDIGGGSTECIRPQGNGTRFRFCSVPLGAASLTESFFAGEEGSPAAIDRARQKIDQLLDTIPADLLRAPAVLASGGTATALAALKLGLVEYDFRRVHDFSLTRDTLAELQKNLAVLTSSARCALPGLGQRRGEIVLAGLLVLREIMRRTGQNALRVSATGLVEGILLSLTGTQKIAGLY